MSCFSIILQSIIKNSCKETNYDWMVFNRMITEESEQIIYHQIAKYNNIGVRFYNEIVLIQPYMNLDVLVLFHN